MASGCTSGGGNSAVLFQKLIPDTQVQYTGNPIPQFGICTGDLLSEIESVILQKLIDFSNGIGISLIDPITGLPTVDLTQCDCFKTKIGCCGTESCITLVCILQAYLDCMCELYADVQALTTKVDEMFDGPYNTMCLAGGITSSSKLPAIVQEVISELCTAETNIANLTTIVTNLTSTLTTTIGNFLATHISTCQGTSALNITGTGASTQLSFKGFVPIGGIIPFAGITVGKFDSTGLGLSGTDWCGWAICNGSNGTPNMLGLVPIMATDVVGTPPVSGGSFPYASVGGEYTHLLTGPESGVRSHTHAIFDPGHSHIISCNLDSASGAHNFNYMKFDTTAFSNTLDGDPDVGNIHAKVRKNFTGVTIAPATSQSANTAHNNVQPYIALYYIQRVN